MSFVSAEENSAQVSSSPGQGLCKSNLKSDLTQAPLDESRALGSSRSKAPRLRKRSNGCPRLRLLPQRARLKRDWTRPRLQAKHNPPPPDRCPKRTSTGRSSLPERPRFSTSPRATASAEAGLRPSRRPPGGEQRATEPPARPDGPQSALRVRDGDDLFPESRRARRTLP